MASGTPATKLHWASRTDVGRVRAHNEDALLVAPPLFLVADGMGGHAAGDVASHLAVAEFETVDLRSMRLRHLVRAARRANEAILAHATANPARAGMGTTLTGFAVLDGHRGPYAAVVNVGDSRTYLFRDGVLEQITVDHSLVQALVDAGEITPGEAAVHPQRNVVTRALGVEGDVGIDTTTVSLRDRDRLVACSDGLTTVVPTETMTEVLAHPSSPADAAQMLVDAALEAGAPDNVSVIVVDVSYSEIVDDEDDADTIPGDRLPSLR